MTDTQQRIKALLTEHPIVLFMKGSADFPQCGFSGRVVHLLKLCNAVYKDVNVLDDEELRQGIKEYGQWPTIPQLYIKGELVGGSDILTEMYEAGELQKLIDQAL